MNPKISIAMVVYDKEIPELFFCLRSIEIYFDLAALDSIYIVIQGCQELAETTKHFIEESLHSLAKYIVIVKQRDLLGNIDKCHGWYIQQALKIKIASITSSDYALILDCKNHFVNHVSSDAFFCDGIPLYVHTDETQTIQKEDSTLGKSFINAHKIFQLDYTPYIGHSLGVLTPFLFERKHITALINYLERRYLKNFADLFLSDLNTSEFYLYAAYLRYQGVFDSAIKFREDKISRVIWESSADDIGYIEWIKSMIYSKEVKVFGIHKTAYGKISEQVMDAILDIWSSRNLAPESFGYLANIKGCHGGSSFNNG